LNRGFVLGFEMPADHGDCATAEAPDGKRSATGYHGPTIDPADPTQDVVSQANPWEDLWFYSNPIFAIPG
jgi:hypothetical protein